MRLILLNELKLIKWLVLVGDWFRKERNSWDIWNWDWKVKNEWADICDIVKYLLRWSKYLCLSQLGYIMSKDLINNDWYPNSTSNKNKIDEHY